MTNEYSNILLSDKKTFIKRSFKITNENIFDYEIK